MSTINVDLPESFLATSGQSREDFVHEARFLLVLKLFELGRISSGLAAEACGMPRVEFLFAAGRAGVPVADLDTDELDREFADA